jgi:hypothetical protein
MFVLNQNIKGGGNITAFNAFNKRTSTNFIDAAIGAVSSLVGGLVGKKSQSDANQNIRFHQYGFFWCYHQKQCHHT